MAAPVGLEEAREACHDLLDHGRPAIVGALPVATRAHRARRAGHAIDEPRIEVADGNAEPALTEIMVRQRRRLVARDVEHALVHHGERQERRLALRQPGDLNRDRQRTARSDGVGHVEGDFELAVGGVHLGMSDGDGPAGHGAVGDAHRPVDHGRDIGPRAPFSRDRHFHRAARRGQGGERARDDPVVHDEDLGLTGKARLDEDLRHVADAVDLLVERDARDGGRVAGLGRDVPAGVERRRCRQRAIGLDGQLVLAPLDRRGDLQRVLHARLPLTFGDAGARAQGLVVPLAVRAIPLEAGLDALEPPAQAVERDALAIAHRDDIEKGGRSFFHRVLETRADADALLRSGERQDQAALYRAAVGIDHLRDQFSLQRLRRGGRLEGRAGERDPPLLVRVATLDTEALRRRALRCQAEHDALEAAQRAGRRDHDLAAGGEVGAGRPEQVARIQRHLAWPRRVERGGAGQREIDALRLEIGHPHRAFGQRRRAGIGMDGEAPRTAHGGVRQRHGPSHPAGLRGGERHPRELLAVRPGDDAGQRQVIDRERARIAHVGHQVDGRPGAVDASLGGHEHVQRCGGKRRAAGHAAIGEVEGFGRHVEEHEIRRAGRPAPRGDERRPVAARAAQQAGGDPRMAGGVGAGGRQHAVVARHQRHLDALQRGGRAEGTGEDVQAVGRGEGRQADIGDHEPLRGPLLPIFRLLVLHGGREHVDARPEIPRRDVDHRQGRHDLAVEVALDVQRALPDLGGLVVAQRGEIVAVERGEEFAHLRGELALVDAQDRKVHLVGIHRRHRNGGGGAGVPGGHDIGTGVETREGAAVTHEDARVHVFGEPLARGRGQPGPQRDRVAPAMLEAADADLRRARRHGVVVAGRRPRDPHVVPGPTPFGERLGDAFRQHHAGAGPLAVRLDVGGQDAETVLLDEGGELLARIVGGL